MTDLLDRTFEALRADLPNEDRLADTHTDRFFTFVHDPADTLAVHARLRRWRSTLQRDGWSDVEVCSLRALLWDVVEASERWDEWLVDEDAAKYAKTNRSMRDVVLAEADPHASPSLSRLFTKVAPVLEHTAPGRLVLLTDAALLHPWATPDKLGNSLHGKINCPTVLFYPGRRQGKYGLHFLGFYPDGGGGYRTTILGGS